MASGGWSSPPRSAACATYLADDRNALLHRPKSPESLTRALRRALDDPDLRARLAGAALQTVREQFDERRAVRSIATRR